MPPPLLGTPAELPEQTNTGANHRHTEKNGKINITGHCSKGIRHELNCGSCTSFDSFHKSTSSGFCQDTHCSTSKRYLQTPKGNVQYKKKKGDI